VEFHFHFRRLFVVHNFFVIAQVHHEQEILNYFKLTGKNCQVLRANRQTVGRQYGQNVGPVHGTAYAGQ
jgi:nicotinic acid phosphoribosyltransferase